MTDSVLLEVHEAAVQEGQLPRHLPEPGAGRPFDKLLPHTGGPKSGFFLQLIGPLRTLARGYCNTQAAARTMSAEHVFLLRTGPKSWAGRRSKSGFFSPADWAPAHACPQQGQLRLTHRCLLLRWRRRTHRPHRLGDQHHYIILDLAEAYALIVTLDPRSRSLVYACKRW